MARPTEVVIDLAAARHNLSRVRALAPRSRVLAVIKANGYGHGLLAMARAFAAADAFGVACLEEARALREAGVRKPLLLLEGPFEAAELNDIKALDLDIAVHTVEQVEMLEAAAKPFGGRIWLKIDTGMHRLGFAPESVLGVYSRLLRILPRPDQLILMTHFANAHDGQHDLNRLQLDRFEVLQRQLGPAVGRHQRSAANSGATSHLPAAHYEWLRPGIMLYGVSPGRGRVEVEDGLRPVMTLRSRLISVRQLAEGETVGYGGAWRCPEPMPVGVVALGYGDGYPRAASGAPVLVKGARTQVIGVPSMDMVTVDLRPAPEAAVGDEVVFWGAGLPVEEVAGHAGTIAYELLASMRERARHVHIDASASEADTRDAGAAAPNAPEADGPNVSAPGPKEPLSGLPDAHQP